MKKVSSSEEDEIIYILGLGIKVRRKPTKTVKGQPQNRVLAKNADTIGQGGD